MWFSAFAYVAISVIAEEASSLSLNALTPEMFVARGGNADEYTNDIMEPKKRNGIEHQRNRWPNGVIPYVIDGNMDSNARAVLQKAVDYYHQRTCIRWVPRTNQRDYVLMTKPSESVCNSHVGKTGGSQKMNLPDWCINSFGSVVHEMMHAIGFHHEQSRPDRDSYITVYWQNIKEEAKGVFFVGKTLLTYGTPYDYGSIMHYGSKAFSKNGQHTLVPKNGVSVSAIGQRNGLSSYDIYKIKVMYQCKSCDDHHDSCSGWANAGECQKNSAYMHKFCRKSCNLCGGTGACTNQHTNCSGWARAGECQKNPAYMLKNCKKACGVCQKRRGLVQILQSQ